MNNRLLPAEAEATAAEDLDDDDEVAADGTTTLVKARTAKMLLLREKVDESNAIVEMRVQNLVEDGDGDDDGMICFEFGLVSCFVQTKKEQRGCVCFMR